MTAAPFPDRDAVAEKFIGDDEANAMLSRPQRAKYAI